MTASVRESHLGFAVVKLHIGREPHFLMRFNRKWRDVNFIGGHASSRDAGDLMRTARRELLEEVPTLRRKRDFSLAELTGILQHGPVFSKSARQDTLYTVQFFLVLFLSQPDHVLSDLGGRTENVLVSEKDLLRANDWHRSGLVEILNQSVEGGLPKVPFSWGSEVTIEEARLRRLKEAQLYFDLDDPF